MNDGPYMSWWVDLLGLLFIILVFVIYYYGGGWLVDPWQYFP